MSWMYSMKVWESTLDKKADGLTPGSPWEHKVLRGLPACWKSIISQTTSLRLWGYGHLVSGGERRFFRLKWNFEIGVGDHWYFLRLFWSQSYIVEVPRASVWSWLHHQPAATPWIAHLSPSFLAFKMTGSRKKNSYLYLLKFYTSLFLSQYY